MTDLIPHDAALSLPPHDSDGEPSGMFDHKIFVKLDALRAIPAIDTAAIREAALREALDAVSLAAWKHCGDDSYSIGLDTGARVQNEADRDAILALIGEKK